MNTARRAAFMLAAKAQMRPPSDVSKPVSPRRGFDEMLAERQKKPAKTHNQPPIEKQRQCESESDCETDKLSEMHVSDNEQDEEHLPDVDQGDIDEFFAQADESAGWCTRYVFMFGRVVFFSPTYFDTSTANK